MAQIDTKTEIHIRSEGSVGDQDLAAGGRRYQAQRRPKTQGQTQYNPIISREAVAKTKRK